MIIDEDVYLSHFGVKGMRWGVVKTDPGAANTSIEKAKQNQDQAKAKAEKAAAKAKKFSDKAAGYQAQIDAIDQKKASTGKLRPVDRRNRAALVEVRDQALKDAKAKEGGHLTDKEKKILIGAGVVATVLAASYAYDQLDSGKVNQRVLQGKAFLQGKGIYEFKQNPDLARAGMSADEIMASVVSKINPDYGSIGAQNNCRRCTFAYEMRRRGNEVAATKTVTASGQTFFGLHNALDVQGPDIEYTKKVALQLDAELKGRSTTDQYSSIYKAFGNAMGKNKIDITSQNILQGDRIFEALAQQPNGSRGELGVAWAAGGGHSMAYEIINGRPHIFDTQSRSMYTNPKELLDKLPEMSEAGFTRLDNVPLDNKFLLRWLKDAK